MRPLRLGAAVLVAYFAVALQPAVAAANLLQNGDFSQGLTGWQEVCDTFGEQPDGNGCTSTSASGLTLTGSHVYSGAQQTVATSTNVVLSGTVTVTSMVTCNTDNAVLVRAILRNASSTELGRLTFYHHPYTTGCTPYTYANDSTHYYQDMPSWVPGTGAQSFQMDVGSLMAQVPGVDPSAVRNITVELLDYADTSRPTITLSSFDLSSGGAPPGSGAPVNTAPPAILGTPQQGDTLTVSLGSWRGMVTGYGHQWFACNGPGTSCSAIAGATGTTYTLRASDVGHSIYVQEVAFNGGTAAAAPARSALVGPVVSAGAPPPPPPPPVIGKSVDVSTVSGVVFVALPNGQSVPLSGALSLPSGTQVDARAGSLRLTTAAARRGQTQSGVFGGAVFKVTQARAGANRGLTTLAIVEGVKGAPSYRSCRRTSGRSAHAARLSSRVLQTLHSTVHGRFRTRGRYSAGTVRGTSWDTTDRCDGTLTVVHRGTVLVTDFARHRTVAVNAGHSYLARAG